VDDPLEEDLRMLAHSQVGQRLLDGNGQSGIGLLNGTEREVLRRLLTRFDEVR